MGQIVYENLNAELAKKIKESIDITNIATANELGIVKVDGTTVTIDADGTLHAVGGGTGGLTTADIVDNLTSDDATKVLSAKQGKALKTLIDATGTVKFVNNIAPKASGNVELVAGDVDAFTKTEVNAIKDQLNTDIREAQTNLTTHEGKVASATELGHVKIDGTTVTLNGENQLVSSLNTVDKTKLDGIEAGANKYVLPTASNTVLGGVKVDNATITIDNGVIKAMNSSAKLPSTASFVSTTAVNATHKYIYTPTGITLESSDDLDVVFNTTVLGKDEWNIVEVEGVNVIIILGYPQLGTVTDYHVTGRVYRNFAPFV